MVQPRVAVVTGSNKGIGFGIVRNLCKQFDGIVYLTARDVGRGKKAVEELNKLGLKPEFHQLEIDDADSVANFAEFIRKKHGGIDILVNNAAIAYKHDAPEPFGEQAEVTLRVNFFALINVCNALFPLLRPHARVVNVSSALGFLGRVPGEDLRKTLGDPNLTLKDLTNLINQFISKAKAGTHTEAGWQNSAYGVSKVAVSALTRIQHREFLEDSREDIVINHVHPGYVITDMSSQQGLLTVEQGADAPTYAALLPAGTTSPKGDFLWHDRKIIDCLGLKPEFHQLDIDDSHSVANFAEFIRKTHGGIDILVNNAAIAYKKDAREPFGEQAEVTLRVNFFGLINVCNALFPLLRPHARVVNVSSASGFLGRVPGEDLRKTLGDPNLTLKDLTNLINQFISKAKAGTHTEAGWQNSAYGVSKVAVSALTRIQNREFLEDSREDIVINHVHPGYVVTDMSSQQGLLTVEQGADVPTYAALLPAGTTSPKGDFLWHGRKIIDWLGLKPEFHQLDIDDAQSITDFANFIKKTHGGIDVLVNNAAIAYKNDATEPFGEQAEVTLRINFFDLINICSALFPFLRPHARVVNLSSSAGFLQRIPGDKLREKFANPQLSRNHLIRLMNEFVIEAKAGTHANTGWPDSAYCVSKVGVSALTRIQQQEFLKDSREDIIVNHVHPGYVDTDMTSHKGPLTIEEGADAPTYLALLPPNIESPRGDYIWFNREIVDWVNGPLGLKPGFHQLDVDDPESITNFAEFIKTTHGGIDVLVNNAAIGFPRDAPEPFGEQAEITLRVNFFAVIDVCNALFPLLRPHARGSGRPLMDIEKAVESYPSTNTRELAIECVVSKDTVTLHEEVEKEQKAKAGTHLEAGWLNSAYSVSKVAVSALTRIQHRQFLEDPREDIVINHIHPGYVDTDLTNHKGPLTIEQGADAPTYAALLPPGTTSPKGDLIWYTREIVDWVNGPTPKS
ncbi:unnamed protein product [Nezara viridula]|uniref:carbonyl reductase (NADPH) n=1 Tax=Nezara viridula TaxID=85310 RepID=A0A9P0MUR5_NEZVI|nr:unnamed protein product [Nezara viridula]